MSAQASPHDDSFSVAYEQYADTIFRHCSYRLFSRERGKEIMQETFMKTWEYIVAGNVIENMQAFLYRTANNLIIDEIRRRVRRPETSLETLQEEGFDPAQDGGEEAIHNELSVREIFDVLREIEEPYRSAVIWRYIDGLSPAEIAAATGETANVVSVRIHRGLRKLKDELHQP